MRGKARADGRAGRSNPRNRGRESPLPASRRREIGDWTFFRGGWSVFDDGSLRKIRGRPCPTWRLVWGLILLLLRRWFRSLLTHRNRYDFRIMVWSGVAAGVAGTGLG